MVYQENAMLLNDQGRFVTYVPLVAEKGHNQAL